MNENLHGGHSRYSTRIDRALDEKASGLFAIPQNQRKARAEELFAKGGFEVSVATGNVGQPTYRVGLAFDLPGGRAGVSLTPSEAIAVAHHLILAAERMRTDVREAHRVENDNLVAAVEQVETLERKVADLTEQNWRDEHSVGKRADRVAELDNAKADLAMAKVEVKGRSAKVQSLNAILAHE